MGRIIFIRHGQSIANAEGRFTRGPHEGLSERGKAEARERARHLATVTRAVHLYTSPFARAQQTAAAIGHVLDLEARVVEALREQYFGDLHGQPHLALADGVDAGGLARWDYRPPEGETLREVADRVGPAVEDLANLHRGEEIVVVSHGGVMAALRAWITEGFGDAPTLTANASGFWVDHRGGGDFARPETVETLVPAPRQ